MKRRCLRRPLLPRGRDTCARPPPEIWPVGPPAARPRRRALAFGGGADAQAAHASRKPSLASRSKRGGSMERMTCVTPQHWRISVDGSTVAFGTASLSRALPVLSSRETRATMLVVSGWSSAHSFLLDPAAVLSSDLLARVFASLSLRERLHCAAVCREWRRLIAPAPPAVPDGRIWERVELASIGPDCAAKLVNHVLPRWGNLIRELNLRFIFVDDVALRAVVAGCPHLRHLDICGCYGALGVSCGNPNFILLSELMLQLYERALPSERFTLFLSGTGFAQGCVNCGRYCDGYVQLVTNSLAFVSSWPVKSSTQDAAVAPAAAWLQCDLAMCANRRSRHRDASEYCETFVEIVVGASGVREAAEHACDFCKKVTCEVRTSGVFLTARSEHVEKCAELLSVLFDLYISRVRGLLWQW